MKYAARITLGVVLAMLIALVAPRPVSRVFTPDASAQIVPLPTIPPILDDPTPTPTPTPEPTLPGDDDGGGGDNGDGGGGGGDDNGGGGDNGGGNNDGGGNGGGNGGGAEDELEPFFGYNRIDGAYNTDLLLAVEARLRSLGWSRADITKEVFAPFIIGGRANWIDSWGFPRFGPGLIVRTHEGQDVFCEMGQEVLATEKGTVDFDDGGLGGKIARLHRSDGSYFYYAHLSDWNTRDFKSGDKVEPGDVIAYCGNTGNAAGGAPHVHFGWYGADGDAKNPMRMLIKWLRTAERHAISLAQSAADKKLRRQDIFAAAHRFGDAFAPSLEEFDISGDPLLSSGTTPASGAFALAQAALQAALAQSDLNGTLGTSPTTGGSSTSNLSGASLDGSSNEAGD